MTTEATTTTYVAYQHLGPLSRWESVKPVDIREPQQQANDAPDDAFAFFYFDMVTVIVDVESERVETSSGRRNITSTYYIDAKLMTSDDVAALPGDLSILLSNMRANGWDPIVRCRTGNFERFEAGKHELVTTG